MTRFADHKNLVAQKAQVIADRIGKPIRVKVLQTATYAKKEDQAYAQVSGLKGIVVSDTDLNGARVFIPVSQQSFEYHDYMLNHWIEKHRGLIITGTLLKYDAERQSDLVVSQSKNYLEEIDALQQQEIEYVVTEHRFRNHGFECELVGEIKLTCGYTVTCEASQFLYNGDQPNPEVGDRVKAKVHSVTKNGARFRNVHASYIGKVPEPILFVKCGYWHTWSRILSTRHPQGPYVEVNLTSVSGNKSWETDVKPIWIRMHCTSRKDDLIVSELPSEVRERMVAMLGEELTQRLLTEDFLPQIDPELYKEKTNGGAKLEDIRKR
jgi:hypothetical protein